MRRDPNQNVERRNQPTRVRPLSLPMSLTVGLVLIVGLSAATDVVAGNIVEAPGGPYDPKGAPLDYLAGIRGVDDRESFFWVVSAEVDPKIVSFRESATVQLGLEKVGQPDSTMGWLSADSTTELCISIAGSAFEVAGPDEVCFRPGYDEQFWAWSLNPRDQTAGLQKVPMNIETTGLSNGGLLGPPEHQAPFFVVDVRKNFFARNISLTTAAIAAAVMLVIHFGGPAVRWLVRLIRDRRGGRDPIDEEVESPTGESDGSSSVHHLNAEESR